MGMVRGALWRWYGGHYMRLISFSLFDLAGLLTCYLGCQLLLQGLFTSGTRGDRFWQNARQGGGGGGINFCGGGTSGGEV